MEDQASASKSVEICLIEPKLDIKQEVEVVVTADNEEEIIVPEDVYTVSKKVYTVPKKVYTKPKKISLEEKRNLLIVPNKEKEFSNTNIAGQPIMKMQKFTTSKNDFTLPKKETDEFSNSSSNSAKLDQANINKVMPIKSETLLSDEINELRRIMMLEGLEIIPISDTDASTKSVKIEIVPSSVCIGPQSTEVEVKYQLNCGENKKSLPLTHISRENEMSSNNKINDNIHLQEQNSIDKSQIHKGIRNKKNYSCKECDYVSFYLGSLEYHIKTHHKKKKTQTPSERTKKSLSSIRTSVAKEMKSYRIINNEIHVQEQKRSTDNTHVPWNQTKRVKIITHASEENGKKLYSLKNNNSTPCGQSQYIINNKMHLLEQHCNNNRNKHLKRKRRKKVFSCKLCAFTCSAMVSLRNHLEAKHDKAPQMYSCAYCDVKYLRKCFLIKHMEKHNDKEAKHDKAPQIYSCVYCDVKYLRKCFLIKHMEKHNDKEPYFCVKCEFRGLTMNSLINHMLTHTRSDEHKYICNFCDLNFNCKGNLITHMSIHKDKKLYECVECDVSFSQKCLLESHVKNHDSENLICTKCDLKFTNKNILKQHMKSHGINRPIKKNVYPCKYCYFKCENATILSQHVVRAHVGENVFSCMNCSFECDLRSSLEFHKKTCRQELIIGAERDGPKKPKTVASSTCIRPFHIESKINKSDLKSGLYTKTQVEQVFIKSEIDQSTIDQQKIPHQAETGNNSCSLPFRFDFDEIEISD